MSAIRSLCAAALCAAALVPATEGKAAPGGHLCESMAVLATSVMQNRQYGVPREDMLALAPEDGDETPVFRALIAEAYAVPLAETMADRQRTIVQFSAAIEDSCIATLRGMT
jgi:hypothetical protein